MEQEILEQKEYSRWFDMPGMDETLQRELSAMRSDRQKISDCFARSLTFGTGGLRGILGAGTNRMNVYTVAQATQGLADYINETFIGNKSVVIAYDSRHNSRLFAETAARVLAENDITVHLFTRLAPTPLLSFAVRDLDCTAGICITASHNPAVYNGYKVYGDDGCQITVDAARSIQRHINAVDVLEGARYKDMTIARRMGLVMDVPEAIWDRYIDCVAALAGPEIVEKRAPLSIVYTPLNGAGRECVLRILRRIKDVNVTVVPSQEDPDGDFPTCPCPNPEEPDALCEGLELCRSVKPDLLLATDPDCDRIGVISRERDSFRRFSGNEIGILLFDFLCKDLTARKRMPIRPVAVTTIVSTDMADPVAARYGVELRRTLTGFKYIGEQIGLLEKEGRADRFVFGFEESCGYLSGTHARDKDAVNAVMLIALMAGQYKAEGVTLGQAMDSLYVRYGYFRNRLLSVSVDGKSSMTQIARFMQNLRDDPPAILADRAVVGMLDYLPGLSGLPAADVLAFSMEDGSRVIIRPSGTEPKVKAYLFVHGASAREADSDIDRFAAAVGEMIHYGLKSRIREPRHFVGADHED